MNHNSHFLYSISNESNQFNRKKLSTTGRWGLLLVFFTFGFSQWAEVDVRDSFTSTDIKTFVESTTFGLSPNPSLISFSKKRVYVGVGLSNNIFLNPSIYQNQLSGWVPKFSADIFITNNLYFMGRLSQFYSGKDIVQSHNYGIALVSGGYSTYPWQTSVVFCSLKGPQDFALRDISLSMATLVQVADHQIQVGVGKEMYSARFFFEDANILFPNGIKGEINYILLGMHLNRNSIRITPQIRFNPGLIKASIRMAWGIG
jgi:hypothetical protein